MRSSILAAILLALAAATLPSTARAVLLQDFQPRQGQKVGIFIGTFDPPHSGHHATLVNAMKAAGLDFVVVIPNKDAIHKPDATPAELRVRMLRADYERSPEIVVPATPEDGNPLQIMKQIRAKSENLELVGIFGDDILDKNLKNRLSGLISSGYFDSVVINTRGGQAGKKLDETVRLWGKHTIYMEGTDKGMSSTKVRKYIQSHPEIRNGELSAAERLRFASELKVTPEVLDIIRGDALYTTVKTGICATFFRKLGNLLEPK